MSLARSIHVNYYIEEMASYSVENIAKPWQISEPCHESGPPCDKYLSKSKRSSPPWGYQIKRLLNIHEIGPVIFKIPWKTFPVPPPSNYCDKLDWQGGGSKAQKLTLARSWRILVQNETLLVGSSLIAELL